jgi:tetratricopeptide (TPR) repeat protein
VTPELHEPVCDVPQPDAAPSVDDLAGDPGIADLTRKIAANANDAVSRYKRGQRYAFKRAYALAMQDFDAVVRLAPKDAEALNNRCWTRAVVGDLQDALSDCNLALQIDPGLTNALDSHGQPETRQVRGGRAVENNYASLSSRER